MEVVQTVLDFLRPYFYDYLTPACLILIMLGLGLNLKVQDLVQIVAKPKAVVIGLIGQILFLPALAFVLAFIFKPPPVIAIGLILLAACPGGITSNGYTLVARGDVALSVTLTTFSSFITVVSMPLLAYLAFFAFSRQGSSIDVPAGNMMLKLVELTLLPVITGMIVRAKFHEFTEKIKETVRKTAFILLLTVIIGNTIFSFDTLVANFVKAGIMAGILCFSAMGLGYGLSKLFKLPVEQIITITFEIGIQNLTVVIAIANSVLGNPDYAAFALVYSLFVKIGPLSFLAYSRKMLADAKKAEQSPASLAEET